MGINLALETEDDPHDYDNVRNEADIRDCGFSTNKPFLLRQHRLQDTEHPFRLVAISLERTGDLLWVIEQEPCNLPKVRTLPGGLEEEPLELVILLLHTGHGDLVGRVVLVDEVLQDRTRFPTQYRLDSDDQTPNTISKHVPKHIVVVLVVDYRRNTAVGVVLCIFRRLVFSLVEVKVD